MLAKNTDPDKWSHNSYGIGFDSHSEFSFTDRSRARNAIDMSLSVHIDNKRKDILILGEGPTQGLDDTTLAAKAKHPINFTQSN